MSLLKNAYQLSSGLKRLDTGAFVKDYEGQEKEFEQAVQMVLPEVISEDPRFIEKDAPPLADEFPKDSKVFFLGDHAYGVAGRVSETTDKSVSVMLAVSTCLYNRDARANYLW